MDTGRRILVPLDQSPLAEAIVPRAAALAQATGCGLILFEVITPEATTLPMGWPVAMPIVVYEGWATEARNEAGAYLETIARRLRAQGLDVRTEVLLEEEVASEIVDRAHRDPEIMMIAMSTHGRSGFSRLVFGSVAERVLRATTVPLLLLRARDNESARPRSWSCEYQTILVALDGSAFAEQALGPARIIAKATGAALVLTTALPVLDDTGLAEGGVEPYWLLADQRIESDRLIYYLGQLAQQLTEEGFSVRVKAMAGEAGAEILAVTESEQADLIVMTTHGRSGLRRLWLGSVATQVVQGATRPVLLIHADEHETGAITANRERAVAGGR